MLRINYEEVSLDTAIKNNEIYIGWKGDDAESLINNGDYSWGRVTKSLETNEWFRQQTNYYKGKAIAATTKFLNFKKGDYIVIPKPGEYAIAEVLDDRPFLSTAVSNTFARKVRFLLNKEKKILTSRAVTFAKLTTTMGQLGTLCLIGDETYKKAIDELLSHGVKDILPSHWYRLHLSLRRMTLRAFGSL